MKHKYEKMDVVDSIFFDRELQKRKAKAYDVKYPALKARILIPTSFDAGEGTESIVYEQYDSVGVAKIVHSYATDFPRADVKGKEFSSTVKSLGSSYGYNIQEIRAARMANKPLEQRRANAARKAIMQKENRIALWGDAANNLGGFLTNINIPTGTVPADGQGGLTTWASKTPDQIVRDMNLCADAVLENTNECEVPNTLLLPLKHYNKIKSTRMGAGSDVSILKHFLETSEYIKQVTTLLQLDHNKNSFFQSDVMIAYDRNPDALTLEIPVEYEQFEADKQGMDYVIPCHERIGGVIWYYPLSAQMYDGI